MTQSYQLVGATGVSGTRHEFQAYPVGTVFLDLPGVYILAQHTADGQRNALYVGETESLHQRLSDPSKHHQHARAVTLGLSHIAVLHVPGERAERLRIETDLRHALSPPCNDQENALANALLGARPMTTPRGMFGFGRG